MTDRQQMEQELRAQDRKKDDFIALLAHELGNPLAPIRNGLQVLRLATAWPGFACASEFERRLTAYLERYNAREKHPYRWTYTGQPLVRATPFSQTRRQQRQGRAWFGTRPQRFDRALYPPRP